MNVEKRESMQQELLINWIAVHFHRLTIKSLLSTHKCMKNDERNSYENELKAFQLWFKQEQTEKKLPLFFRKWAQLLPKKNINIPYYQDENKQVILKEEADFMIQIFIKEPSFELKKNILDVMKNNNNIFQHLNKKRNKKESDIADNFALILNQFHPFYALNFIFSWLKKQMPFQWISDFSQQFILSFMSDYTIFLVSLFGATEKLSHMVIEDNKIEQINKKEIEQWEKEKSILILQEKRKKEGVETAIDRQAEYEREILSDSSKKINLLLKSNAVTYRSVLGEEIRGKLVSNVQGYFEVIDSLGTILLVKNVVQLAHDIKWGRIRVKTKKPTLTAEITGWAKKPMRPLFRKRLKKAV